MVRTGGRPAQVSLAAIVAAGRRVGMADLSLRVVATELGVSPTALYRHVQGRWELERAVGESLLEDLTLVDDPALGTQQVLLSLAEQLLEHVLAHPGLASYVQTLFPRGEAGRRLLGEGAAPLVRRGYRPDTAVVVVSAVATLAIGYAAALDERRRAEGLREHQEDTTERLLADDRIGPVVSGLPDVDDAEYVRLWLNAAIRGIVLSAPPDLSAPELLARMRADLAGA